MPTADSRPPTTRRTRRAHDARAGYFPVLARGRTMTRRMSLDQLLERASAGDAEARTELYQRFYPRVRAAVHQRLERRLRRGGHALAALLSTGDIVHEVFGDVLRDLDAVHGESEAAFGVFLTTLVEHRLVDQIRRSHAAQRDVRRQVPLDTEAGEAAVRPADDGPAANAARREQLDAYREVLATFPLRTRALLSLRIEDGTPFKELAEQLAFPSADAARKAFHDAHADLLLALRRRGVRGDPTRTT